MNIKTLLKCWMSGAGFLADSYNIFVLSIGKFTVHLYAVCLLFKLSAKPVINRYYPLLWDYNRCILTGQCKWC